MPYENYNANSVTIIYIGVGIEIAKYLLHVLRIKHDYNCMNTMMNIALIS